MRAFRESAEMKYRLMPYIYAQAKECTEKGLPMLRALCIEFPTDPAVWTIEDQYLFGSDLLVAPLMEAGNKRNVYLPGGKWIDYQSGKVYQPGWNEIEAGQIPAVILVRDGVALPHIALAQSTDKMDWSNIELRLFTADSSVAEGSVCFPSDNRLHHLKIKQQQDKWLLTENPLKGQVTFKITHK